MDHPTRSFFKRNVLVELRKCMLIWITQNSTHFLAVDCIPLSKYSHMAFFLTCCTKSLLDRARLRTHAYLSFEKVIGEERKIMGMYGMKSEECAGSARSGGSRKWGACGRGMRNGWAMVVEWDEWRANSMLGKYDTNKVKDIKIMLT